MGFTAPLRLHYRENRWPSEFKESFFRAKPQVDRRKSAQTAAQ
jgi:hypothetical protein